MKKSLGSYGLWLDHCHPEHSQASTGKIQDEYWNRKTSSIHYVKEDR